MPAISSNIQSLLGQCKSVHDIFQADRIPRDHPNHKAAVYHQSYLLGRIQDLRAIIERLGTQNAELIELSHRADMLTPQIRPRRQFSKKLQAVYQRESKLTELMRLDMESLLILGNMTLDQLALFLKLRHQIPGSLNNWKYPFSELYRQIINAQNQDATIVSLRGSLERDIWWLQFNVRSYRNTFIEHLDRPWQRGSSRPVYTEGFSFFIPTPAGSLTDVEERSISDAVEHLLPDGLRNLPSDHWQRQPRSIVQWLVQHIDTIALASEREKVGEAWEKIGGETVSYEVMARRILTMLEGASAIVAQ